MTKAEKNLLAAAVLISKHCRKMDNCDECMFKCEDDFNLNCNLNCWQQAPEYWMLRDLTDRAILEDIADMSIFDKEVTK